MGPRRSSGVRFGRPTHHERRFADYLADLAADENRAALAALRRGLGKPPGEAAELYPYVVRWAPDEPAGERAYYLVASLVALHPQPWPREPGDGATPRATNLGASFARLAARVESASIERRFVALLNAHADDLPEHLWHAVGLLRAQEVPVDWAQLVHDLRGWGYTSRVVQRSWARAFWGTATGEEAAGDAAPTDQDAAASTDDEE